MTQKRPKKTGHFTSMLEIPNNFPEHLWTHHIMLFIDMTEVPAACAAFGWTIPFQAKCMTRRFIFELHASFCDRVPSLIPKLETLSVPSNLIVISGGAVLGAVLGEVHPHSDLDIWCSIAALPHLCRLIVVQGLVLARIALNYVQHSNPLIHHVEQYCLRQQKRERLRIFDDHKYGTWNYDDSSAL